MSNRHAIFAAYFLAGFVVPRGLPLRVIRGCGFSNGSRYFSFELMEAGDVNAVVVMFAVLRALSAFWV